MAFKIWHVSWIMCWIIRLRGRRATDEEFIDKLIQVQARSTQAWQEAYGEVDNLAQI